MAIELRTCQHKECDSVIYGSKNRKYCSDRCRQAAHRMKERSNNEATKAHNTDSRL